MKRRTFNQAALASLTVSIGIPLHAEFGTGETVLECFRHSEPTNDCDWLPFTIGLGQRGRDLAIKMDRVIDPDHRALIYAESSAPPSRSKGRVEFADQALLGNAYSAALIVSLDESQAWPLALGWAHKMCDQDVYLTAAIVCVSDTETALSHPLTELLRQNLDTVVLQQDCTSEVRPLGFHPALQSARLFLMEPGMICYDIADIRTVLTNKTAITSSSRSLPSELGGNPGDSVDVCCAELSGRLVSGVFARWSAGPETLTVADFVSIEIRLGERLSEDLTALIATSVDLSLSATSPGILHAIWTLSEES